MPSKSAKGSKLKINAATFLSSELRKKSASFTPLVTNAPLKCKVLHPGYFVRELTEKQVEGIMKYYQSLPTLPDINVTVMIPPLDNGQQHELFVGAVAAQMFEQFDGNDECPKFIVLQGNHRITALHRMGATDHVVRCTIFNTLTDDQIAVLEMSDDQDREFHLPIGMVDRLVVLHQLIPSELSASQRDDAVYSFEKKEQYKKSMTAGIRNFSFQRSKQFLQPLFHAMETAVYEAMKDFENHLGSDVNIEKFPLLQYDRFRKIAIEFGDNPVQRLKVPRTPLQISKTEKLLKTWLDVVKANPTTCHMFTFAAVMQHDNGISRISMWLDNGAPLKPNKYPDFPVLNPYGSISSDLTDISIESGLVRSMHKQTTPRKRRHTESIGEGIEKNSAPTKTLMIPPDMSESEWSICTVTK
ncbi:hypothetical protein L596_020723 [Steinernema carpocapsae]|nr:hypothetical protein L596_020723 [Steinernema carpocapsae]